MNDKQKAAQRFIDQAFIDRIAWVAARLLLVQTLNDEGVNGLSPVLRGRIERFLASHPAASPRREENP